MRISTKIRSLALAFLSLAATAGASGSMPGTGGQQRAEGDEADKVYCGLPYSQSFENENNDYDGTTYVPKGWLAVGDVTFRTQNINDFAAKDGQWYLLAQESGNPRDDRVYTPFFSMKKGVEYDITFYIYAPGSSFSFFTTKTDFELTVGTEQDAELQTQILEMNTCEYTKWHEVNLQYSPEEDGDYCFSFHITAKTAYAGCFAIDMLTVTAPGAVAPPKPGFAPVGMFNIMDSKLMAFDNSEFRMSNLTTGADSYLWEAEGAEPSVSTEAEPSFRFPVAGSYTVRLTATNEAGSNSLEKTFDVDLIGNADNTPLMMHDPNEDEIATRDNLAWFDTDPHGDFVTGVNRYYRHFAERFAVPEGRDYEVYALTDFVFFYNLAQRCADKERAKTFSLVFYGEKDGKPDLNTVYGRYDDTMLNAWGSLNVGVMEQRGWDFNAKMQEGKVKQPIVAKGPFYVAFEFPDDMWIDEPDANVSRSCVGLCSVQHKSGVSSLYVQPTKVPEGSSYVVDGQYCPIEEVDPKYKGYGLYLVTWVNVKNGGGSTAIALAADGSVASAVRVAGNVLQVSGTHQGERVVVSSCSGSVVASAVACGESCELALPAVPKGVYIVSTASGAHKIRI